MLFSQSTAPGTQEQAEKKVPVQTVSGFWVKDGRVTTKRSLNFHLHITK